MGEITVITFCSDRSVSSMWVRVKGKVPLSLLFIFADRVSSGWITETLLSL